MLCVLCNVKFERVHCRQLFCCKKCSRRFNYLKAKILSNKGEKVYASQDVVKTKVYSDRYRNAKKLASRNSFELLFSDYLNSCKSGGG